MFQHKKTDPEQRGCEGKLPRPPNVELGMRRREEREGSRPAAEDTRTLIIRGRVKIKLFQKVDKC